jgi:hypothetical protein
VASLITADIHMTENPRDSHRWGLFSWLADEAAKNAVDQVLILGDLTDKKDRHPSSLVNRFCDGLAELAETCDVHILKGNHDHLDAGSPFFRFVAGFPRVSFYTDPAIAQLTIAGQSVSCLMLPCTVDPEVDWELLTRGPGHLAAHRYIFTHQTFVGAQRENGTRSDSGVPASIFKDHGFKGEAFSGDIHVPQRIGGIEYVGAPYRIDFGDSYMPRVLLIDNKGRKSNLRFPCPDKHLIEISADGEIAGTEGIKPGDQVKVRAILKRADLPLWPGLQKNIRDMAEKGKWVLYGPELRRSDEDKPAEARAQVRPRRMDPIELVLDYGKRNELDETLLEIGVAILG